MNEAANYGHVIFFSLIGGVFSLIGGILLLSRQGSANLLAKYATPFAAGALLSAVFLDLLPEGIEGSSSNTVLLAALVGIVLFFLAERFLRWFHHHHEHDKKQGDPGTSLIIIGDTMHNILDGVAIAAAFLVSVPTGMVTTIAVAAHEIPQEVGDFGLLLSKGVSRRNVLIVNLLSALATTLAAVVTFTLGSQDRLPVGVLLGLSAGFLLYIATSDIIPSIHEKTRSNKLMDSQPILLLLGVVIVGLTIRLAHAHIDVGHNHEHSHEGFEMSGHDDLPAIRSLTLKKDSKHGYNLLIATENFRFSPEAVGEGVKPGEGHAHVYINGKKVARMYSDAIHLEQAEPGDVIRVTLNVNDHREIIHDSQPVGAEITVEENGSHKYFYDVVDDDKAHSHDDAHSHGHMHGDGDHSH